MQIYMSEFSERSETAKKKKKMQKNRYPAVVSSWGIRKHYLKKKLVKKKKKKGLSKNLTGTILP